MPMYNNSTKELLIICVSVTFKKVNRFIYDTDLLLFFRTNIINHQNVKCIRSSQYLYIYSICHILSRYDEL